MISSRADSRNTPGYYGEMVWVLMMLEQWLRRTSPRGPSD